MSEEDNASRESTSGAKNGVKTTIIHVHTRYRVVLFVIYGATAVCCRVCWKLYGYAGKYFRSLHGGVYLLHGVGFLTFPVVREGHFCRNQSEISGLSCKTRNEKMPFLSPGVQF
jgi:hypothetical protein